MTALRASSAIVRAWTRLYTWRLPAFARDTRRAEIDSDLWEFTHDRDVDRSIAPALHVMARLVAGMPDDVSWRASHITIGRTPMRAAISVGAAAIVAMSVWVYLVTLSVELPAPVPLAPIVEVFPPPPPPPPPPPGVVTRESWTIIIHPAPPSSGSWPRSWREPRP
jgi:hypothetical protein